MLGVLRQVTKIEEVSQSFSNWQVGYRGLLYWLRVTWQDRGLLNNLNVERGKKKKLSVLILIGSWVTGVRLAWSLSYSKVKGRKPRRLTLKDPVRRLRGVVDGTLTLIAHLVLVGEAIQGLCGGVRTLIYRRCDPQPPSYSDWMHGCLAS